MAFIANNFLSAVNNPYPMSVYLGADQLNCTGDGSSPEIHWDTVIYDPSSCFNAAQFAYNPKVTNGIYRVHVRAVITGLTSSHYDGRLFFFVEGSTILWESYLASPYSQSTTDTRSVSLEADAIVSAPNTTSYIRPLIKVSGGTKVVDVVSGSATEPNSYFQVYRVA